MRVNFKPMRSRKEKKNKRIHQVKTLNDETKKQFEDNMEMNGANKSVE